MSSINEGRDTNYGSDYLSGYNIKKLSIYLKSLLNPYNGMK